MGGARVGVPANAVGGGPSGGVSAKCGRGRGASVCCVVLCFALFCYTQPAEVNLKGEIAQPEQSEQT